MTKTELVTEIERQLAEVRKQIDLINQVRFLGQLEGAQMQLERLLALAKKDDAKPAPGRPAT